LPFSLIDRSERDFARIIKKKVEELKDVKSCHQISVRMIGKRYDVTMHVSLDNNLKFEDVHKIASKVEDEVRNIIPNARVTVHTEPVGGNQNSLWKLVKDVAEGVSGSRGVHNIHIQEVDGKLYIDLHLEVAANMTVKEAHETADQVEKKLKEANQKISGITVHVETASDQVLSELTDAETGMKWYIEHVARSFPEIKDVQGIEIRRVGNSLHLELRCYFDSNINIQQAHVISINLEKAIKSVYPNIERIDIHEEPS
jgi:divalent metal cation (Fe/Co/Zn/Cd) transporter